MRFWFKISICQNGMVHAGWIPDNGWKVGSIDSLLKKIRKTRTIVRQRGTAVVDRVRRVAVEDLSQVDKPKRHRSAREISHETAILRSSVHRIIHRDLQLNALNDVMLSCCLKPVASLVSPHSLINNLIVCN